VIYRLTIAANDDGHHQGYRYFASKAAAIKGRSEEIKRSGMDRYTVWVNGDEVFRCDNFTIDACETPKTKSGVIALLNRWASHPDNG